MPTADEWVARWNSYGDFMRDLNKEKTMHIKAFQYRDENSTEEGSWEYRWEVVVVASDAETLEKISMDKVTHHLERMIGAELDVIGYDITQVAEDTFYHPSTYEGWFRDKVPPIYNAVVGGDSVAEPNFALFGEERYCIESMCTRCHVWLMGHQPISDHSNVVECLVAFENSDVDLEEDNNR